MNKKHIGKKSVIDGKGLRTAEGEKIDNSDIPPLTAKQLKRMVVVWPEPKEMVSIRIDNDILKWFRSKGKGYQTPINAVLQSYVDAHSKTGRRGRK